MSNDDFQNKHRFRSRVRHRGLSQKIDAFAEETPLPYAGTSWSPDCVFVISLARRPDRLARFFANIAHMRWSLRRPEVFSAVDGHGCELPPKFEAGAGGWGCLRSHEAVLTLTMQRRISSVLILEDDAEFQPNFARSLSELIRAVPDDWEGLMLGGDHEGHQPFSVAPGVVRCRYTVRTHCYILRDAAIPKVRNAYRRADGHVDRAFAELMPDTRVYAPEKFFVAQAAGHSDIDGDIWPSRFADKF